MGSAEHASLESTEPEPKIWEGADSRLVGASALEPIHVRILSDTLSNYNYLSLHVCVSDSGCTRF